MGNLSERAERFVAGSKFSARSSVRHAVFFTMFHGFDGNFNELVRKVFSQPRYVSKAVWVLFEAGHIDWIPEGTPPQFDPEKGMVGEMIDGVCSPIEDAILIGEG